MFKSKKFLVVLIVIVLVLGFGIYIYSELNISKKPWSVVYLSSGEIYIGKISHFPKFQIHDAYILQVIRKPAELTEGEETIEGEAELETSFRLTPLKDSLWAPKKLYLNSEQVIFYGPLSEDSKAAEAIREAGK